MTFDDLIARALDFGPQQDYLETIKADYAATDIEDILLAEAKSQLLQDLQTSLDLWPGSAEDMTDIDTIVDAQEPRLQTALATLQLAMIFEDKNKGQGSKTYDYWKHYAARYETIKRGLPGLITKQGSRRTRSTAIMR